MTRFTLHHGDSREVLKGLADASVDAVVCDPPYELGFMGKGWDSTGIANDASLWREVLRVLKPGGYCLAFSGTRTYHRMVCAIEDAGFEIRDQIGWAYGSGFPKSLDVSKAIDKSRAGHAFDEIREYLRECIAAADVTQRDIKRHLGYPDDSGTVSHWVANSQPSVPGWADWSGMKAILPIDDRFDELIQTVERAKVGEKRSGIAHPGADKRHTIGAGASVTVDVTAPATDAAKHWEGWGTALKPAWEPICMARKPLIGTVAANVLQHGTGALNIDGCRIAIDSAADASQLRTMQRSQREPGDGWGMSTVAGDEPTVVRADGRWPANLIHDGSDEVVALFPDSDGQSGAITGNEPTANGFSGNVYGYGGIAKRASMEPRGDSGSAARFFYCAKASQEDRNEGCNGLPERTGGMVSNTSGQHITRRDGGAPGPRANHHPTVKPTDLMRYLCRLVTPKGGTVLDPFMGSGSTGKAAMLEGFNFIGIDLSAEYIEIARARIEFALRMGHQPSLLEAA